MRIFFSFSLVALICVTVQTALAAKPTIDRPIAVMRAMDKVTGRVAEVKVLTGRAYKFGTLFLTVHACRETSPEFAPESAVFLEITEAKPGIKDEREQVFNGWMFASSPALSAMEHPVYDLWLMGCKKLPDSQKKE